MDWCNYNLMISVLYIPNRNHVECNALKISGGFQKETLRILGALPAEYPTHRDRSRIHFTPIHRPDRVRRKSTIGRSLLSRYLGFEPSIEGLDTELRNGSFSTRYWCKDSWIFYFLCPNEILLLIRHFQCQTAVLMSKSGIFSSKLMGSACMFNCKGVADDGRYVV